jgi:hypothetical protein
MMRREAAEILKEVLISCRVLEGKSVKLMLPDSDSVLSKGCQIHVQKIDDIVTHSCINRIARKHRLAVHEDEDYFVIYKPRIQ